MNHVASKILKPLNLQEIGSPWNSIFIMKKVELACFQIFLKRRLNSLSIKSHLHRWVTVTTCMLRCPLSWQKMLTTSGQTTNSLFLKFPLGSTSGSIVQITCTLDKVLNNETIIRECLLPNHLAIMSLKSTISCLRERSKWNWCISGILTTMMNAQIFNHLPARVKLNRASTKTQKRTHL